MIHNVSKWRAIDLNQFCNILDHNIGVSSLGGYAVHGRIK